MFLNFQTEADVRRVIVEAMIALNRPAQDYTVASWIWNRSRIDGTRGGVFCTVEQAMKKMATSGLIKVHSHIVEDEAVECLFEIADLLTAISMLSSDD